MSESQVLQMTHSDYLTHSAYGASDLIKMGRSFAYWKWRKANPEKPGRPLVVGSATHLMLQAAISSDESLIKKGILVYQDGSSLTQGFKKFQADHHSQYCLDVAERALCERMVKALTDEPEVMGYLKGALIEPTIMMNYPDTEILCKCRPDYLHLGRGVSINIKTTTDASESGFINASRDWQYEWQSALYIDILSEKFQKSFDEIHILVEKAEDGEPIPVKIFSFGDDTLSWARTQLRMLFDRIPECEKSGVWPKNTVHLEQIDMPLFARKMVSL